MGETKYINEKLPKEQRLGQVGYNNEGEEITIITLYGKGGYVDVKFTDDGSICKHRTYSNFYEGKIKHPIRYEETIAYYIIEELQKDLNSIWNWEKNNERDINPYETYKHSRKKVFLYCDEHDYHNYDMNGNKIGYEIVIYSFTAGSRCGYCGNHKTHFKDSIGYLYHDIAERINIPENDIDIYSISPNSSKKVYEKCPECGEISRNKKTIYHITRNKTSCENCSDGISIPNKMLRQISKQLNLNWVFEYTEPWMKGCRFDAYDIDLKQPIEMDASYGDNHKGERKEIDNWKDEEAIKHGMKIPIRVNLMDTKQYNNNTFEYIKKETHIALSYIYNLDDFNWELAWEKSQKSLAIKALKLYKEEHYTINQISEILKVNIRTIFKWLNKLGVKNKYDLAEERKIKAFELYKEGCNVKQIAEILNVNKDVVSRYLRKLGVKNQYELAEERKIKILKLHEEGYNVKEIAETLSVTDGTIRKWLKKFREKGLI